MFVTERWRLRRLSSVFAVGLLASAEQASAYCRTTTCDEDTEQCPRNAVTECLESGEPLFWDTRCLSFGVHEHAAPSAGISYDDALRAASEAFLAWTEADCGNGTPSLEVWDLAGLAGPVTCERPEFNQCAPNANSIVFREDSWPHVGQANVLAFTNVTYAKGTGQILDADIEVNAATVELSISDRDVENDLQSVLTHEVGHFLGFDHSLEDGAVMAKNMRTGSLDFRWLGADDVRAVCEVYPPDREVRSCSAPKVTRGFTRQCVQSADAEDEPEDACRTGQASNACACRLIAPNPEDHPSPAGWLGAAVVAAVLGVRRRFAPRRPA